MKPEPDPVHTRNWRDIPQPVKARAMSGGGRRRWFFASLRVAGVSAVAMLVGYVGWKTLEVFRHGPEKMPAVMKTTPVKDVLLVTDGVLDLPWVRSTLSLPPGVSLLELNLPKLRERLLKTGQVRTADLTLNLPDTLAVTISERFPVARLKVDDPGAGLQEMLVARDGVVFKGIDYDPAMIETLPWIEGFKLVRQKGEFLPIAGMSTVADLLARAQLEAEHRYRTWEVVSLARLASDEELEVRTQSGTKVIFSTRDDYFRQLGRLDLVMDKEAQAHPDKVPLLINLSFGLQVPVTYAAITPLRSGNFTVRGELPLLPPRSSLTPPSATPHLPILLKREL